MKQIDLHVHSTCSDGTDSPAVLVDKAVDKGLAAFALTDHDTTMGVKEALLACENVNNKGYELEVIPGYMLSGFLQIITTMNSIHSLISS